MTNKIISEFLANDYNMDLLELVVLPGADFSMYVTPMFKQSFSQGYDKLSTRIVKNFVKKCDLFVDVGAHYGYYSILAAKANKDIRIIAVEPIEENFKVLTKNLIQNNIGAERTKCINAAVSSNSGKIKFYKSEASDNSSVLPHPNSKTLEQLEVNCISLDDLIKNQHYKSLFIKTDTNGNEFEVLKGLSSTFNTCDDITILLEINPKMIKLAGTSCEVITEYLDSQDFTLYAIDDREFRYFPLNVKENLEMMLGIYEKSYFNVLCVKKERALSVAFFSHSSNLAGAERSLVDLVEGLCNDLVLCSVLLPSNGPLKDMLLNKGAVVYELPDSIYWWWINTNNSLDEKTQKLQLAEALSATLSVSIPILKQLNPDIVYTQTIVIPWGALCAEILSIPHALSVCEYADNFKFYFGFPNSIRALYDSSKAIFTNTKSVKNEDFKGISDKDNKIEVVYRGVRLAPNNDLDVMPQNYNYKNKSEIKIAIFGTIHENKGQEDIVRAGIELMNKGLNVKIYIFGYSDPHYLAYIKNLISACKYNNSFIIKDFVNDPIKHMEEMDIVVSCSRIEANGRTLYEAILLNKPIVYSNSGGPNEIFTDKKHGLAYKCADVHSLFEKLLFVINHPDKTTQRVKTAKEYVLKNFNPKNYSVKIGSRLTQLKGSKMKAGYSMQALFGIDFLVDGLQSEFERKDSERDGQITNLKQTMAERDAQIAELIRTVAERDSKLASLDQEVSNLNQRYVEALRTIEDIQGSASWRITAPMRYVSSKIKNIVGVLKLLPNIVRFGGGVIGSARKAWRVFSREGWSGVKRRILFVGGHRSGVASSKIRPDLTSVAVDRNDYSEWVRRYDTLTVQDRAKIKTRMNQLHKTPLISVVMPTYNPRPEWLIEAIESVRKQIYPYWELCIADDASTDKRIRPILERYVRKDTRIKVVFREKNGHICAASNGALSIATCEWVALLDHDDRLSEHALFWMADAINANPEVRLVYSDEDKIDEAGRRFAPYFKCDWNVDLFYSHNMFSHLGVYRADLLKEIGGFREGLEGSQDYDLALRCIERIEPKQIHHIPRVLYHWRMHAESTAKSGDTKPYSLLAGQRALDEHFRRQGVNANAELLDINMYRIRVALPENLPLVSLIILTRNGLHLLQRCIESILSNTTYPNYEILIVDNGTDEPEMLQYLKKLQSVPKISVARDNRPFNFSALNNTAVKLVQGEVVGLLNNDLEVIAPEWLSEMVSHALRPEVGAVGARLWYPDNTLQHGGVVIGLGGVAGHAHSLLPRHQHGYFGRASLIQSFSAVTAACLLIRKSVYEEVAGFNENDLSIAFNDVDFCLRVGEAGYRNLWTPYADLYHHESATRGYEDSPEKQKRFAKEVAYMKQQWGDKFMNDPAFSPNLTLDHEDFSLAWPPRVNTI